MTDLFTDPKDERIKELEHLLRVEKATRSIEAINYEHLISIIKSNYKAMTGEDYDER